MGCVVVASELAGRVSKAGTPALARPRRAALATLALSVLAVAMPSLAADVRNAADPASGVRMVQDADVISGKATRESAETPADPAEARDDDASGIEFAEDTAWMSAGPLPMMARSMASGGAMTPNAVIVPPPATNNTLPGHTQYLNNWLLGNDYQACGASGADCLTIDRANFNYSFLSLVLNLAQTPNSLDIDGNQPGNHLTLVGSVQSDSYIQFQDSNYTGNNNSADCIVIGLECTWSTNPAQNNQVIIGDGSYANGSNTVVMGTNARHQLPTVTAASAGFTGGPDTNYAARLGNSVVIGDNSFGNANRQTIVGFGAASTHANSVALGAGSATAFGAQTGYTAFGLAAPQTSSGEVSFGSAGATRKLTNVAAGSSGTDAVNVAQLQGALSGIDGLDDFAVQYNDLGGTPDYGNITLQGPAGTTISNLRAGAIATGSTEAVNGSQIFAISQADALHLGGGASVAPDGTVTAPSYVIGGTGYDNVGSALDALDTGLETTGAFAVQYDDDGTGTPDTGSITLEGAGGTTIGNLTAGEISATSTEAINGAQLHGTGTSIATAFGAGAVVNPDGSISAPAYSIDGSTYSNVGDAFDAVDTALAGVGGNVGELDAFAVRYDDDGSGGPDTGSITLAGAGGTRIDNVAAGQVDITSMQAVNGAQLFALGD